MTTGLLTDSDERFTLGVRNGFRPTAEPVSDTAATPFGLTLRTTAIPRNIVRVHAADGGLTMGKQKTDRITLIETDGRSEDSDTDTDYLTD